MSARWLPAPAALDAPLGVSARKLQAPAALDAPLGVSAGFLSRSLAAGWPSAVEVRLREGGIGIRAPDSR